MKAVYNISYGLYVITTSASKKNGCIVNSLAQITSEPTKIMVCVNKSNFTCKEIQKSKKFNVSILDMTADFELIKHFGFASGKDIDKFENFKDFELSENEIPYITKATNSYLSCEVLEEKDVGSHIMFVAGVSKDIVLNQNPPITYEYYQNNLKPKRQTASVCYVCSVCGYVYEGEILPEDYICPLCKHGASYFEKQEKNEQKTQENSTEKGDKNMAKKYVCPVCGYVYEGENPPDKCPLCGAALKEVSDAEMVWASEHVVGDSSKLPEEIVKGLRMNFNGECSEVGMYLAMSRVAFREGYPEVGLYYEKAAFEEAEHAAKFAELLGEVVTNSTKKNLEMRVQAEYEATSSKTELATLAKKLNLDAVHDTVHEMARDEARHGRAFKGLLERYFKD